MGRVASRMDVVFSIPKTSGVFWVEFDSSPDMSNDLNPGSLLLSERKHMFFVTHPMSLKGNFNI